MNSSYVRAVWVPPRTVHIAYAVGLCTVGTFTVMHTHIYTFGTKATQCSHRRSLGRSHLRVSPQALASLQTGRVVGSVRARHEQKFCEKNVTTTRKAKPNSKTKSAPALTLSSFECDLFMCFFLMLLCVSTFWFISVVGTTGIFWILAPLACFWLVDILATGCLGRLSCFVQVRSFVFPGKFFGTCFKLTFWPQVLLVFLSLVPFLRRLRLMSLFIKVHMNPQVGFCVAMHLGMLVYILAQFYISRGSRKGAADLTSCSRSVEGTR